MPTSMTMNARHTHPADHHHEPHHHSTPTPRSNMEYQRGEERAPPSSLSSRLSPYSPPSPIANQVVHYYEKSGGSSAYRYSNHAGHHHRHPSTIDSCCCSCFTSRFVNSMLFALNFVFLTSGIILLALTLLYGRPDVSTYLGDTTKYHYQIIDLLGPGHLVKVLHYSMMLCGLVITVVATVNITISLVTSWSRNNDYYYYKRNRKRQELIEKQNLLRNSLSSSTMRGGMATIASSDDHHGQAPSPSLAINHPSNLEPMPMASAGHNNNTIHNASISTGSGTSWSHHSSSWTHCADSSYANCCYIFLILLLFTLKLTLGLLTIVSIGPEYNMIALETLRRTGSLASPLARTARHFPPSGMIIPLDDHWMESVRDNVDGLEVLRHQPELLEQLYKPFKCCGWLAYDDYEYLSLDGQERRNQSAPVADACCKTLVPGCGHVKHPNNIYMDGCADRFAHELREYILLLAWSALMFAALELIGLMFAMCHYVHVVTKQQQQQRKH